MRIKTHFHIKDLVFKQCLGTITRKCPALNTVKRLNSKWFWKITQMCSELIEKRSFQLLQTDYSIWIYSTRLNVANLDYCNVVGDKLQQNYIYDFELQKLQNWAARVDRGLPNSTQLSCNRWRNWGENPQITSPKVQKLYLNPFFFLSYQSHQG